MSRQDGDVVPCVFTHAHPTHVFADFDGATLQCPGVWPATVALPGSISHGTLRREDLINTFSNVLTHVFPAEAAIISAWYEQQPGDSEDEEELLEKLTSALEESAPEGYRFGAIEGDGSDFGFWEVEPHDEECYSDHNEDIRTKGSCDYCHGTD